MYFKENLLSFKTFLMWAAFIALWISGCNHAKKKHDLNLTSAYFLISWYYGLERFWHKTDYVELNDNVRVAIYIMMSHNQTIDPQKQMELNEAKKKFKTVLETYDAEEIKYIKEGTEAYMLLKNDFENQGLKTFTKYQQTGIFEFTPSNSSVILTKKLSTYGLEEEMKNIVAEEKKFYEEMKEKIEINSNLLDEIDKSAMLENFRIGVEERKAIFTELFHK